MKIILGSLGLVLLLFVAAAVVVGPQLAEGLPSFSSSEEGQEVRAESIVPRTLTETISAPGEIEPHTKVEISAEVSARIVELPFREGQLVKRDEVVCRLDDRDLQASLLSARARRDGENFRLQADQARLAGLKTNVEFANRELERIETLFASGDVSQRDLDTASERAQNLESSVNSTTFSISVVESSLAAAEADIERAEDGLNNTIIRSPMDGVITIMTVEVGEIVTGSTTNPGTRLMMIADLSRMIMKAQVAESDIARVVVGQQATIFINAYPDDEFSGTARKIALQRSGNPDGTGFFEVEVELDLQGRQIYSGLVANVDIKIESHLGLAVPYQAIVSREIDELPEHARESHLLDRTRKAANVVYRIVDGKTVCTPVRAGASDLTHRLILEGIDEGDVVMIGPFKLLEEIQDDATVRIEGEKTDAEAASDTDASDTDASDTDTPNTDASDTDASGTDASDTDASDTDTPDAADTDGADGGDAPLGEDEDDDNGETPTDGDA